MKKLYDKPWKIGSIIGTIATTGITVAYSTWPTESKIILDTILTLIDPLLENSK